MAILISKVFSGEISGAKRQRVGKIRKIIPHDVIWKLITKLGGSRNFRDRFPRTAWRLRVNPEFEGAKRPRFESELSRIDGAARDKNGGRGLGRGLGEPSDFFLQNRIRHGAIWCMLYIEIAWSSIVVVVATTDAASQQATTPPPVPITAAAAAVPAAAPCCPLLPSAAPVCCCRCCWNRTRVDLWTSDVFQTAETRPSFLTCCKLPIHSYSGFI